MFWGSGLTAAVFVDLYCCAFGVWDLAGALQLLVVDFGLRRSVCLFLVVLAVYVVLWCFGLL